MIEMTSLVWAAAAVLTVGMICVTALKGWRGWLELRRLEIASRERAAEAPDPTPTARIEMADLKERLRKLEAIARGVDL